MSVYTPRAFEVGDDAAVAHLIRDYPFATLLTLDHPEPFVSHVPLQYDAERGPKGTLLGHMARANPHWRHFGAGASIAIFHGPHAYVSPSWYAEPATAVPTWNYVVAHVHGRVEAMTDLADTRGLLDDMIRRYEKGRSRPWRLQLEGRALAAMLEAIVGFRFTIERIDAKLKLSQNRSAEDRDRVIAALRAEDYADAAATAEWMERYARGN
ncbi:MAG: FMN-binding negative transcriptional regulator [Betaproteobacteria bacterium]|nr:MAG: FMN-binding negative transcriptional regulator [Betaproteobacteria bacterium]